MKLSYRNERNARFIAEQYRKPLDKPEWYKIEDVAEDETDILVYDYIGWPYNDSREFVSLLAGITKGKITVRINSPGGDVFDAHAIYNAIKSHPLKPNTRIESLAASAASYISMAGNEKQAYKNAMIMIHEPMTGMWGNQHELREVADILQQINGTMVDMYADNTNIGKRDIKDMLKAETWLATKDAKEKGFIDTIVEAGKPVEAKFDLSMYASVPEEFKPAPPEPNIRNAENALREVCGLSLNEAKAVLARGWKAVGEETIIDASGLTAEAVSVLNKFKL